jgi:predicted small lipoprotein YifL
VLNSFAQSHHLFIVGIAMRRAVGLILVFLALSACGNKAALYLPPPERDPQQDSKRAPRQ